MTTPNTATVQKIDAVVLKQAAITLLPISHVRKGEGEFDYDLLLLTDSAESVLDNFCDLFGYDSTELLKVYVIRMHNMLRHEAEMFFN